MDGSRERSGGAGAEVVTAKNHAIFPDGWLYRTGTWDFNIFDSVVVHDEYGVGKLDFSDGDVAVDVGAHFGSFAYMLGKVSGGKALVIAYEPEPGNFRLLMHNARMGRSPVACVPHAVNGTAGYGKIGYCPNPLNTGGHTLIGQEGSVTPGDHPVAIVDLGRAVATAASLSASGRVRVVKLDCEGGEHSGVYFGGDFLRRADLFVGEYHGGERKLAQDFAQAGFDYSSHVLDAATGQGLFRAALRT